MRISAFSNFSGTKATPFFRMAAFHFFRFALLVALCSVAFSKDVRKGEVDDTRLPLNTVAWLQGLAYSDYDTRLCDSSPKPISPCDVSQIMILVNVSLNSFLPKARGKAQGQVACIHHTCTPCGNNHWHNV